MEQYKQFVRKEHVSHGSLPLVSVIVAAYNCAPYLHIAIESALSQTFSNLEVVVVDDASTDETLSVAQQYTRTGRVRVFSNPSNQGPSHSRNRAIQEAHGEWIAQLDGDDWMDPVRIERMLAVAHQTAADWVADDLLVVDDTTMTPVSSRFMDKNVTWKEAREIDAVDLVRYDLGSIKPLMRRQFILDHTLTYPIGIRYGEDFLFLLKALLRGAKFVVLPEPLYRLRRGNTGSLTTQKDALYRQTESVTRELLADTEIRSHPEIMNALQARLTYLKQLSVLSTFKEALANGRIPNALSIMLKSPGVALVLLNRLPFMLGKRKRRMMNRQIKSNFHPPVSQGIDTYCMQEK